MPELPPAAWNDTGRPFPHDATIHELLRAAATRHPDRPALVAADGSATTYAELDRRTDRLARLLHELGAGPGTFVGLYSDRTPLACEALLATLKAGASYVPLDPDWPVARVVRFLDDLDVRFLVIGRAQLKTVQELRWGARSLRHVLCPEIGSELTWSQELDRDLVEEFFDFLSGQPDPLEAAGFNLRRSDRAYTPADVTRYRDHVAALALEAAGSGAAILEVGCGSGQIVAALCTSASRYVATDPSPVAVARSADEAARRGVQIETLVAFGHEVASRVTGPFDLAILASTVQFLPDLAYLLETLRSLVELLRPGGKILLADVIDPALEHHAGVRVPPALSDRLPELIPGIARAEVRRRAPDGFAGELRLRYDVVITTGEEPPPTPAPAWDGRIWTGAHVAAQPATPPEVAVGAENVAYAIFTSGSTGTPKAVLVQHRSVVNLIDWINRTYGVGPDDRILFVTSFCFDLSVYDLFGVLAAGGSVRVATSDEVAEPDALVDVLETEPVTIWDSAPGALDMLMPFVENREPTGRDTLRLALLSGDWIPVPMPDRLRAAFPGARVVALGGATECTVWSNHYPVGTVDPGWPSIPYGKPMQNARYYVLDDSLSPCPVGTPGGLYIAGDCVAVGYHGAPETTATKFMPDPWAVAPGERMYRTGDRARWLADGNIEFLGRLDDQVKVRGYRIELAEVRTALSQCPGVRAAIVLAREGRAGKELVAFYVPTSTPTSADAIRDLLSTILPGYMLPARITEVASFPLQHTGKIDRAALLRMS